VSVRHKVKLTNVSFGLFQNETDAVRIKTKMIENQTESIRGLKGVSEVIIY